MSKVTTLLLLTAALTACDGVTDDAPVRAKLRLDLNAMHATHLGASVLDVISLRWGEGDLDGASQRLTGREDQVEFAVTIPATGATFVASVFSNNGSLLYSATQLVVPASDGFTAVLDLAAVAPVLSVRPDTIDLRNVQTVGVIIRNAGIQTLTWTASAPCNGSVCLMPRRTSGTLAAGRADTVVVGGYSETGASPTLRIDSQVGVVVLPSRFR